MSNRLWKRTTPAITPRLSLGGGDQGVLDEDGSKPTIKVDEAVTSWSKTKPKKGGETLYNYGAQKVAIFGLGQIGCTPAELGKYDTNGSACVDTINDAVRLFNNRLKPLVDDFNKNLPGAKFTLINITNISGGDPSSAGITVINTPCCNATKSSGLCYRNQAPCSNRSTYAFWDAFHPTEIINVITAGRVYNASSPLDAYPVDICTLAHL
ncbi:hypothetical protein RJ640_012743 [Escallonia rubra]|uniref:GDSL esterase/lipase n=1 Tax=Escallonia rubra TaxID=112253 RepID=A0AA88UTY2_9ASTE|nr:hypothetical protein RJ640_012743 [Escallonia rubra]